jgi:hypothetical protein
VQIEILIQAEVERVSGPFASRDDLEQAIIENIDDPGTLEPGENEYEVTTWEVTAQEVTKRKKPKVDNQLLTTLRAMRQTLTATELMAKEGDGFGRQDPAVVVQLERLSRQLDGVFVKVTEAGLIKP